MLNTTTTPIVQFEQSGVQREANRRTLEGFTKEQLIEMLLDQFDFTNDLKNQLAGNDDDDE